MKWKQKSIFLLIGILMMYSFSSCNKEKPFLKIIAEGSSFSDYEITEGKVFLKYHLTIKNTHSESKTVMLKAYFPDDVDKLLTEKYVYAKNNDFSILNLEIPANSDGGYDVVFIGDFAGTEEKHDRLLPDILLENIPSDTEKFAPAGTKIGDMTVISSTNNTVLLQGSLKMDCKYKLVEENGSQVCLLTPPSNSLIPYCEYFFGTSSQQIVIEDIPENYFSEITGQKTVELSEIYIGSGTPYGISGKIK